MQDLLAELLWRNTEIDEAADRLRQTLPGFSDAKQAYDHLSEQVRELAGYDLFDQYFSQLIRYTGYEVQSYYSLGLGLREEIVKALEVQVSLAPLAKELSAEG